MDGSEHSTDVVAEFLSRQGVKIKKRESVSQGAIENVLAHFGIKGMKWGVRKKRPLSAEAKAKQAVKDKVKKDKVGSITNAKLQEAIRRMQLEQDFKRLSVNEQNGVTRWLSSTLLEIGKREVQVRATKAVASVAIKKAATGGLG